MYNKRILIRRGSCFVCPDIIIASCATATNVVCAATRDNLAHATADWSGAGYACSRPRPIHTPRPQRSNAAPALFHYYRRPTPATSAAATNTAATPTPAHRTATRSEIPLTCSPPYRCPTTWYRWRWSAVEALTRLWLWSKAPAQEEVSIIIILLLPHSNNINICILYRKRRRRREYYYYDVISVF